MKNLLIALTIILTFSFCQSKEKTSKTLEKEPVFRLSEHYAKFKFHDLKEFKIDSLDYDKLEKRYKRLDSFEINQIIQGDKELLQSRLFYYSTFSDTSLIALIGETSDENGLIIWLNKYDKTGKLKAKTAIASRWGDAGDAWYAHGKMIKFNTFICTDVGSSMIGDDIENSDIEIDSTIVKISFQKNDVIVKDTLLSKRDTVKQENSN